MEVSQVLAMVLFAGLAGTSIGTSTYNENDAIGLCRTAECEEVAERIKRTLDPVAEPCEDFNAFACGNIDNMVEIPDDKGYYVTAVTPNKEAIFEHGRVLMSQVTDTESFETDKKLREVYGACMNTDNREKLGLQPMKDHVLSPLGGWPVAKGDCWKEKPWVEVLLQGNNLGLDPAYYFMRTFIWGNPARDDDYIFYLLNPKFDLATSDFVEGIQNRKVKSYYEYMVKAAVLFGADEAYARKEMEEVLKLETEMAQLHEKADVNVKSDYTLGDIEALFSKTDFSIKEFLKTLHHVGNQGKQLNDADDVTVVRKEYFHLLPDLLLKTENRIIVNYIVWRMVASKMTSLNEEARNIANEYKKVAKGSKKSEARWKECLKAVGFNDLRNALAGAASSLYVRNYFSQGNKKAVEAMFPHLEKAFMEIIENSAWMDASTKNNARSKVEKMGRVIGTPDELFSKDKVDQLYKDLSDIKPTDHLKNELEMTKFTKKKDYRTIEEKIDVRHWSRNLFGAQVSALYNYGGNIIKILAGMMQGANFNVNVPQYLNYGALGQIIGHEMGHGFDPRGKGHDKNGKKQNWWTDESLKEYDNRTQCLSDYFSKIHVNEASKNLDGKKTLHQNFADSTGLTIAYKAYEKYVAKSGSEQQLPGLEKFSPKQMFWISFGQILCSRYTTAALKDAIDRGYRLPFYLRTMALRNSPEFAEAFSCPTGSFMNPGKKCMLW